MKKHQAKHDKTGEIVLFIGMSDGRARISRGGNSWSLVSAKTAARYTKIEQPAELIPPAVKIEKQAPVVKILFTPDKKDSPVRNAGWMENARECPCGMCGAPPRSEASHRNTGDKGLGIKASDICAALCRTCHKKIDERIELTKEQADYLWLQALWKTIKHMMEKGLL
jgi:hypothetical protein